MGKNIVLCADGTGKTDDGASPSNVARLCSLLDLTDRSAQICGYDPGVGVVEGTRVSELTSDADRFAEPHHGQLSLPRIARVTLGLGFGYGLQTNVKQMYGYLCKEYEPGDSVYLFGFSRGAFTVRVVAGIIARCGLLSPPNLDKFDEAFELYEPHFEGLKPRDLAERQKDIAAFKQKYVRPDECRIHFLGVWDTVKSYGYVWPRSLPHTRHNPIVDTVRHALSIDERRSMFSLTSWGGRDFDLEKNCIPYGNPHLSDDVREVWFAGDHSDVGGGHKDATGLANISLGWMVNEAAACGLRVDPARYRQLRDESSECKRHDVGAQLAWRASEHAPRRDIENCPLPPTRKLTVSSAGPRKIADSRRGSEVLIHDSAERFYDDGEKRRLWGGLNPSFVATLECVGKEVAQ